MMQKSEHLPRAAPRRKHYTADEAQHACSPQPRPPFVEVGACGVLFVFASQETISVHPWGEPWDVSHPPHPEETVRGVSPSCFSL